MIGIKINIVVGPHRILCVHPHVSICSYIVHLYTLTLRKTWQLFHIRDTSVCQSSILPHFNMIIPFQSFQWLLNLLGGLSWSLHPAATISVHGWFRCQLSNCQKCTPDFLVLVPYKNVVSTFSGAERNCPNAILLKCDMWVLGSEAMASFMFLQFISNMKPAYEAICRVAGVLFWSAAFHMFHINGSVGWNICNEKIRRFGLWSL